MKEREREREYVSESGANSPQHTGLMLFMLEAPKGIQEQLHV